MDEPINTGVDYRPRVSDALPDGVHAQSRTRFGSIGHRESGDGLADPYSGPVSRSQLPEYARKATREPILSSGRKRKCKGSALLFLLLVALQTAAVLAFVAYDIAADVGNDKPMWSSENYFSAVLSLSVRAADAASEFAGAAAGAAGAARAARADAAAAGGLPERLRHRRRALRKRLPADRLHRDLLAAAAAHVLVVRAREERRKRPRRAEAARR